MEKEIKIAAKLYQCRDTAKAMCKISGKDFWKEAKEYIDIITGVMVAHKIEHIPALLEISKTKTYQADGITQMWFMAALTEMLEPSKNS